MKTIAVAVNKGEVGKTTISKHLAVAATQAGLNALVLDMDTQQNATSWGKRRADSSPVPPVRFVTEIDLPDMLAKAEAAGCDLVLIDTPPGRSSEAPAAVESADLVLVPFWLTDSFDGVAKSAGLARRLGKPAVGILNHATPNSRSHEEAARDVLDKLDVPMAPPVLHRYEAYRAASPRGQTVQEVEPDSRAAAEVAELFKWVIAQLHLCTKEQEAAE